MLKFVAGLFLASYATCVASEGAKAVSVEELNTLIASSDKDGLFVEFYAPWCGHCKELAPKWEWMGSKFNTDDSKVSILKVDADANPGKLGPFGVSGFPTVKLFVKEGGSFKPQTFQNIREPKQLVQFINKHLGTEYDAADYVPAPPEERKLTPEQVKLYESFSHMNNFEFKQAKALLEPLVESDDRRSKLAGEKALKKVNTIGSTVDKIVLSDWLQVDPDTYMPPTLDAKDVITLFFRLDFRSSSRNSLEPLVDEFYQLQKQGKKIQVVRMTGSDVEVPEDIEYPIAVSGTSGLKSDDAFVMDSLAQIQSAIMILNNKVIWHGHCGILDETLLKTVQKVLDGVDPASLDVEGGSCGAPAEGEEGLCTAP